MLGNIVSERAKPGNPTDPTHTPMYIRPSVHHPHMDLGEPNQYPVRDCRWDRNRSPVGVVGVGGAAAGVCASVVRVVADE